MDKVKQSVAKLKAKSHKKLNWFKNHRIFVIVSALVIGIFVIAVIGATFYYHDKAAPGTTVANVAVGGQTKDQIKSTASGIANNIKLSLTYDGKSVTANASDLGIKIDASKIADQAVQTGQQNLISVLFNKTNVPVAGSFDKQKVQDFVKTSFPELTTDPKDAQVVYDKNSNEYVVQEGAIGRSVKLDDLYTAINRLISSPKISSYEIKTDDAAPIVSNESANKLANELNDKLAKAIRITNNNKVIWTVDPWSVADWTTLTLDKDKGTYDVSYDLAKIKSFVNSDVVGQLSNKPVNQKAITNANGDVLRVISAGRNGQAADNTDTVADDIEEALNSSSARDIALTTKDAPYGTDKTVAKDGHWIEANLSDYSVKLYDGTNLVWQTNRTSHGKASTPTITGLYTVWSKVYNQCMPNPPSSEPLCNIHYVTYWERSGYAFHEAWWLDDAKGNVNQGISHGCINMFQADAKRVYDWASIGTPVWVHY